MKNLKSVDYNGNKLYSLKYDTMFKAVFGKKPTERLKVLLEDIIEERMLLAILYDMNIVNYSQIKLESCSNNLN